MDRPLVPAGRCPARTCGTAPAVDAGNLQRPAGAWFAGPETLVSLDLRLDFLELVGGMGVWDEKMYRNV